MSIYFNPDVSLVRQSFSLPKYNIVVFVELLIIHAYVSTGNMLDIL